MISNVFHLLTANTAGICRPAMEEVEKGNDFPCRLFPTLSSPPLLSLTFLVFPNSRNRFVLISGSHTGSELRGLNQSLARSRGVRRQTGVPDLMSGSERPSSIFFHAHRGEHVGGRQARRASERQHPEAVRRSVIGCQLFCLRRAQVSGNQPHRLVFCVNSPDTCGRRAAADEALSAENHRVDGAGTVFSPPDVHSDLLTSAGPQWLYSV